MAEAAEGGRPSRDVAGTPLPALDADQLEQLLGVLPDADAVELKVLLPDSDRRPLLTTLGVDPLKAGTNTRSALSALAANLPIDIPAQANRARSER